MLSLQVLALTGLSGSIVQQEEMEALFGGFNKTLPLHGLTLRGFSVRGCLAPLAKSFRLFPKLMWLYLGEFNMNQHDFCCLLQSLRFIPDLTTLSVKGNPLSHAHCCTEVNKIASITHKNLEQLNLDGICLTSAVAAVLGQLLPEMSSLQELELTGLDESTMQAEEMEALFGGFNKTLPLYKLRDRSLFTGGGGPLKF